MQSQGRREVASTSDWNVLVGMSALFGDGIGLELLLPSPEYGMKGSSKSFSSQHHRGEGVCLFVCLLMVVLVFLFCIFVVVWV